MKRTHEQRVRTWAAQAGEDTLLAAMRIAREAIEECTDNGWEELDGCFLWEWRKSLTWMQQELQTRQA